MLTGGDYIISFFKTLKQTFIKFLNENMRHILWGGIRRYTICNSEGNKRYVVHKINLHAWIKLVCSVYLTKQIFIQ